jgi:hypothetical protein
VLPSTGLVLTSAQPGQVHVGYPAATENVDVTARPASVNGGTFEGQPFSSGVISADTVPAGAVQDAYGNCNGSAFGEAGSVSACAPAGAHAASTTGASVGGASVIGLPNTASMRPSGAIAGVSVVFLGAVLRRSRRRARGVA